MTYFFTYYLFFTFTLKLRNSKGNLCFRGGIYYQKQRKVKLIRNNFVYHLNKTLENGNTYWERDKRRSGSDCKAKVALDQQNNF